MSIFRHLVTGRASAWAESVWSGCVPSCLKVSTGCITLSPGSTAGLRRFGLRPVVQWAEDALAQVLTPVYRARAGGVPALIAGGYERQGRMRVEVAGTVQKLLTFGELQRSDLGNTVQIGFDLGPFPDMRQHADP